MSPAYLAAVMQSARATVRGRGLTRTVSALRGAAHPALVRQLRQADYFADFWPEGQHDPLYFLTHRYHLAKPLTVPDRMRSALFHYAYEQQTFDDAYLSAVYRGDGITVWRHHDGEHEIAIRLRATEDNRYEGDVSLLLSVDGAVISRMAYSVVDAAPFGLPPGPLPFVTRNQVYRGAELDTFRRVFRQQSPPYFCLAAVVGLAEAQKLPAVATIRRQVQIAYEPQYDQGFANSYCTLWSAFGARDAGPLGYLVDVPPRLTSLSEVTGGHRNRALRRRARWAEVTASATDAVRGHVLDAAR